MSDNTFDLTDKVALVTGGSHGIGAAVALELAARGAHIAIAARNDDDAARQVKARIESQGRRSIFIPVDLSQPPAAQECVAKTIETLGGIDVLVHSAGALAAGSLLEVSPEDWHHALDVHVHATFYLCRAAAGHMKAQHRGAIILLSSGAGLRGCAGAIAYGVVKGALPQFARALARELADDNIRVNAVAPGVIRTRFQDILTPDQAKNNIDNRIPLHREGTPQDVAQAVAMLVTNTFITGETIAIDGGMTMRMV